MGIESHLFTVFKVTFRLTFEQFFQSHTVSGIRSWESMKHFFISFIFHQACQTQFVFHRNSQTWAVAKFSESLNISQWIKLLNPLIPLPTFFSLKSNISVCLWVLLYDIYYPQHTNVFEKKPVWTFQHRMNTEGVYCEHSFATLLILRWKSLLLHWCSSEDSGTNL